jgi:hypothetical protein
MQVIPAPDCIILYDNSSPPIPQSFSCQNITDVTGYGTLKKYRIGSNVAQVLFYSGTGFTSLIGAYYDCNSYYDPTNLYAIGSAATQSIEIQLMGDDCVSFYLNDTPCTLIQTYCQNTADTSAVLGASFKWVRLGKNVSSLKVFDSTNYGGTTIQIEDNDGYPQDNYSLSIDAINSLQIFLLGDNCVQFNFITSDPPGVIYCDNNSNVGTAIPINDGIRFGSNVDYIIGYENANYDTTGNWGYFYPWARHDTEFNYDYVGHGITFMSFKIVLLIP